MQCRSVFNVHARAPTTAMIEEQIGKSKRGGATHKPDRLRECLDTPVHLYSSRILTFDLLAARIAGALSDRRPRPRAQRRAARASCAAALRCRAEYRRCRHVPLESLCPFTRDATAKAIRSAFAGSEETRRNMARGQRSALVRLRKRYFGWRSRRQSRGRVFSEHSLRDEHGSTPEPVRCGREVARTAELEYAWAASSASSPRSPS